MRMELIIGSAVEVTAARTAPMPSRMSLDENARMGYHRVG